MKRAVIIGVMLTIVVLVAGLVAYAYTSQRNITGQGGHRWLRDHHTSIERGMHGLRNRNMFIEDNYTRSTITVTGTIEDIDYNGWINIVVGDKEYRVIVKGWWENNTTNDRIPFTEILRNLSINATVTITGYLGIYGNNIGAQIIEYNGTLYLRPCLS